jgi:hypothetical protein
VPLLNTELVMINGQIARQGLAVPFRVMTVYIVAWIQDQSATVAACIERLVRGIVRELVVCTPAELAAVSEAWTMGELQEECVFVNAQSHTREVRYKCTVAQLYSND